MLRIISGWSLLLRQHIPVMCGVIASSPPLCPAPKIPSLECLKYLNGLCAVFCIMVMIRKQKMKSVHVPEYFKSRLGSCLDLWIQPPIVAINTSPPIKPPTHVDLSHAELTAQGRAESGQGDWNWKSGVSTVTLPPSRDLPTLTFCWVGHCGCRESRMGAEPTAAG